MADPRTARLDELMQARRLELGMKTWRALAVEAGISYETLRALRTGGNVAAGTADALEKALRWAPGSIAEILQGGDPRPIHEGFEAAGTEGDFEAFDRHNEARIQEMTITQAEKDFFIALYRTNRKREREKRQEEDHRRRDGDSPDQLGA